MPAEESPTSSGDASICYTLSTVHAMALTSSREDISRFTRCSGTSQLLILLRFLYPRSREKTLATREVVTTRTARACPTLGGAPRVRCRGASYG